jgi:hypothetical protein
MNRHVFDTADPESLARVVILDPQVVELSQACTGRCSEQGGRWSMSVAGGSITS